MTTPDNPTARSRRGEHLTDDEARRVWAENQAVTEHNPPATPEVTRDIDEVLTTATIPDDVRADLDWVRQMMINAWYFGYTTGMADSAKIDKRIADGEM